MCVQEIMQAAATYFRQYYSAMLRRAQKYVGNIEDAEDIVSECWLKLMRNISKLADMSIQARSTYIMKSVQSEAVSFLRKRRRQPELFLQDGIVLTPPLCNARSPDQVVESREFVHELLCFLPNREREIISMYIQGYSTAEISAHLELSDSSVRVYKHRAQQRLNDYIRAVNETVAE